MLQQSKLLASLVSRVTNPASFSVFIVGNNKVIMPCNELARDLMGELFSARAFACPANMVQDTIKILRRTSGRSHYDFCGAVFDETGITYDLDSLLAEVRLVHQADKWDKMDDYRESVERAHHIAEVLYAGGVKDPTVLYWKSNRG